MPFLLINMFSLPTDAARQIAYRLLINEGDLARYRLLTPSQPTAFASKVKV